MAQVLLVEDDAAIRTALTRALRELGHAVEAVGSGMPALTAAVEHKPDVVLLDLGLPDIDGADVLSMLRAVSDIPVIIATARDDETEMVRLLDLGADDYVIKPFTAAQLNARIKAVLRRMGRTEEDPVITVGGLVIDTPHQGKGYGRATVRELIAMAVAGGHPSVGLSYSEANVAARALYAGLGFVGTDEQVDGETVARLVLARDPMTGP